MGFCRSTGKLLLLYSLHQAGDVRFFFLFFAVVCFFLSCAVLCSCCGSGGGGGGGRVLLTCTKIVKYDLGLRACACVCFFSRFFPAVL